MKQIHVVGAYAYAYGYVSDHFGYTSLITYSYIASQLACNIQPHFLHHVDQYHLVAIDFAPMTR